MIRYMLCVPDIRSHLCWGDTRHFSTFSTPPHMPIPTLIFLTAYNIRLYCRGDTNDCNGTWIRDVDPLVAILRSILREKKRIFKPERIKGRIKCPHNLKENWIVILRKSVTRALISHFSTPYSPLRTHFLLPIRKWVQIHRSGRC
jgi:hypothetical protein